MNRRTIFTGTRFAIGHRVGRVLVEATPVSEGARRWITSVLLVLIILAGTLLGAPGATALGTRGDAAALLALLLAARTTVGAETSGAFDRLSGGDQNTARALFEAQSVRARGRLNLDQIAVPKRNGETWDGVFRLMKAQGLVADRTLAEAVSRFNEAHRARLARERWTKAQ